MFRMSKKLLYAIEAVLDIAYNSGSMPVQSKDITKRQGIPRRYLEQVLQQLVRAGILSGVRGPRGGYLLARERRRITVADITRVVALAETEDATEPPSDLGGKVVWPMWTGFEDEMMARLETVTIEELCLRANSEGVRSEAAERLDFII
jgi:Rrf2 family iron-sulfur cluster assembly transcriptional regulator